MPPLSSRLPPRPCSRFLEFVQPDVSRLSLAPILSDIKASMIDECDFTKEAAHLQQASTVARRGEPPPELG